MTGAIREHVFRFVDEFLRFGFHSPADAFGFCRDAFFFCFLFGQNNIDGLAAGGNFRLLRRLDLFRGLGGARAGGFCFDCGGAFIQRLLVELDGLVHLRALDRFLAFDFQAPAFRLMAYAGIVQAAFGGDLRAFDLFLADDLGFAQGLDASDLELLQHLLAFQLLRVELLFRQDLFRVDGFCLGNPGSFHGLVCCDLSLVDSLVAGNFQRPDLLVPGDLLRGGFLFLRNARLLDAAS